MSGGVIPFDGVSVIKSLAVFRTDYRLWPNVIVGGGIAYIADEYVDARRTNSGLEPRGLCALLYESHLHVGLRLSARCFDSTGLGIEFYDRNVYLLSLDARSKQEWSEAAAPLHSLASVHSLEANAALPLPLRVGAPCDPLANFQVVAAAPLLATVADRIFEHVNAASAQCLSIGFADPAAIVGTICSADHDSAAAAAAVTSLPVAAVPPGSPPPAPGSPPPAGSPPPGSPPPPNSAGPLNRLVWLAAALSVELELPVLVPGSFRTAALDETLFVLCPLSPVLEPAPLRMDLLLVATPSSELASPVLLSASSRIAHCSRPDCPLSRCHRSCCQILAGFEALFDTVPSPEPLSPVSLPGC